MTGQIAVYVIGALGVLATAFVTWRIARRATSGSIATTDAATLWKEGAAIRQEALARADKLQVDLDSLRERIVELENENRKQAEEMRTLLKQYRDAERELERLRRQIGSEGGRP